MSERTPTRRIRFTRRHALTLAGVAGAATVAGGAEVVRRIRAQPKVIATECRFCTMHCGLLATTRAGEIVDVKGDPSSQTRGFICEHGRALQEVVHGPHRLRRPLIRSGDAFKEATWDEAYAFIAQKLDAVKKTHGPQALALQTGWPFVRHPMIHLLHRFCRAFGTPNLATVASLCEASGRMGRGLVWGSNYSPRLAETKTLLVWGANPPRTAPPWAFMVTNVKKRGKLVVIDPVRTDLARNANLFIQIRPGTDGALALGMIRHILSNNLENKDFVANHTSGLEALRALSEPWTLEKTEAATGARADDVKRATDWFATEGPGGVYDGLGIEHHGAGVDTVRLVASMVALCGYADSQELHDRASTNADDALPSILRIDQQDPVPPAPQARPIGNDEYPYFCAVHRQAQASLLPRAMLEDKPYPLRALMVFGANPAVTTPDSNTLRKAYQKLDLLVVVDPFLSETAELADVVLPAASFAEQKPLSFNKKESELSAVTAPRGESKPDSVILFELARALGLETFFPWHTIHEAFAVPRQAVVDPWVADKAKPSWAPAAAPRFPTASGKIEFDSTVLPRFGLAGLPSVILPTTTEEFPVTVVSGPRQRAYINSQFHQSPSITRLVPLARAQLHPNTARTHGIEESTRMKVTTAAGDAEFIAEVTSDVPDGVVVVPAGWSKEANANRLSSALQLDPISGFPRLRAIAGRVSKA